MKPTPELLKLAKQKAAGLQTNTQIRLTADEKSYWVFNMSGLWFIGSLVSEGILPKFFKNMPVYIMQDKDGNKVAELQKLFA